MSPVARRQGPGHTGRAVTVALVGVGLAMGLAFLVANLASRGEVEVNLGDDTFEADASSLADNIAAEGAPVGLGDLAAGSRPIWVDHTGDDPTTGWRAFGAFVPDDPSCTVNWDRDRDLYVADCDDTLTFPRSGRGLRPYPVEVIGDDISIDLQDRRDP